MYELCSVCFLFFNDTATTEIYTLSLHDALPILSCGTRRLMTPIWWHSSASIMRPVSVRSMVLASPMCSRDRKSTRLNSSHANISYAVFCLKKKKHALQHNMYCNDMVCETL